VVAVGSLLGIVIGPSYAIFFALYDYSGLLLPIKLSLIPALAFFAPLLLLALGRLLPAKVLFALLASTTLTMFAYVYSTDSGVQHVLFCFTLIAFLIFDKSERPFLIFFTALPAVLHFYASYSFTEVYPATNIDRPLLEILFAVNIFNTFFIISIVTFVFYKLVYSAEERLVRFSGAVSEYLDPSLVDNLRREADLSPRIQTLTVFFSDLVGSTRISFAMDQENYGNMINAYVHEMQSIIKAHGAYIEDISGDGILGYFGNFGTHGEIQDAARCVTMAWEMVAKLEDLVPGFKKTYGLPEDLHIRVGISSGEAMVGKTEGARAIYTANGDVVNLGAKLEKKVEDISARGGILLSESTGRCVAGDFRLELHEMDIEGEALVAYAVTGRA
jgi:class 3 adenylate cyclase